MSRLHAFDLQTFKFNRNAVAKSMWAQLTSQVCSSDIGIQGKVTKKGKTLSTTDEEALRKGTTCLEGGEEVGCKEPRKESEI